MLDTNTFIEYQYRDADNNKFTKSAILPGRITPDEITAIMSSLQDGELFLPGQVGLPNDLPENFGPWDAQIDHPFFELNRGWFLLTTKSPTLEMPVKQLVENFKNMAHKWHTRIGPDNREIPVT